MPIPRPLVAPLSSPSSAVGVAVKFLRPQQQQQLRTIQFRPQIPRRLVHNKLATPAARASSSSTTTTTAFDGRSSSNTESSWRRYPYHRGDAGGRDAGAAYSSPSSSSYIGSSRRWYVSPTPPLLENKVVAKVPTMGDSITEGTVVEWVASVGQYVREQEDTVALVETDKVTVEIKAEFSGVVTKQFGNVYVYCTLSMLLLFACVPRGDISFIAYLYYSGVDSFSTDPNLMLLLYRYTREKYSDDTVEVGAPLYEIDTDAVADDATAAAKAGGETPPPSEDSAASTAASLSSSESESAQQPQEQPPSSDRLQEHRTPSIHFLGKDGWSARKSAHRQGGQSREQPGQQATNLHPMYGRPYFSDEEMDALIFGGANLEPAGSASELSSVSD